MKPMHAWILLTLILLLLVACTSKSQQKLPLEQGQDAAREGNALDAPSTNLTPETVELQKTGTSNPFEAYGTTPLVGGGTALLAANPEPAQPCAAIPGKLRFQVQNVGATTIGGTEGVIVQWFNDDGDCGHTDAYDLNNDSLESLLAILEEIDWDVLPPIDEDGQGSLTTGPPSLLFLYDANGREIETYYNARTTELDSLREWLRTESIRDRNRNLPLESLVVFSFDKEEAGKTAFDNGDSTSLVLRGNNLLEFKMYSNGKEIAAGKRTLSIEERAELDKLIDAVGVVEDRYGYFNRGRSRNLPKIPSIRISFLDDYAEINSFIAYEQVAVPDELQPLYDWAQEQIAIFTNQS